MPALLGCGVCPDPVERDGGAEAAVDLRSSGRAPQPLPVEPLDGDRVLDQLPEDVDERWWRFGGVSFGGVHAAQYWVEFILWEVLLNERPYNSIIELGTWEGGFSCTSTPRQRRGTWPSAPMTSTSLLATSPVSSRSTSLRRPRRSVSTCSKAEPVIVLCDGGNKPRELKTFARYVTPASTLVVHDWGTEMLEKDIPPSVEMVHEDWCVELGSASRVFRKLPYD